MRVYRSTVAHRELGIRSVVGPALTALSFVASFLAFGVAADLARAQSFTRITDGPHVNDGGASRSVNWIDADDDGDLDLFVSNGPNPGVPAFLYLNDGAPNWTFTKVTDSALVGDAGRSDGASFGDADNDGDLDALVATWYGDVDLLYFGDGPGSFVKVDDQPPATQGGFSESCSWGDYDGDGLLDLCVANSGNATPQVNFLYHNEGGGAFTQVTTGSVVTDTFRSRGVNWVDYDGDGDQDLFVANESGNPENLYRNDGGGVFTPVAGDPIVTSGGSSWTSSWADIDDDGDLDCYVGNHSAQNDFLFLNDGDGSFTRVMGDPLVTSGGYNASSAWGDYDNDGDLDLFTTSAYGGSTPRTNFLFTNQLRETGTLAFTPVAGVPLVTDTGWTYGFAWGDYDRDGDLDLFQARTFQESENNALYRNDNANGNHWLTLRLAGVESNRSAIGAKVRLLATIDGELVEQLRCVEGQSGYCGQNLEIHFGLGDAAVAETIRVDWPSGAVDLFEDVAADQHLVLTEGSGTSHLDNGAETKGLRLEVSPNPFQDEVRFTLHLDRPQSVALELFDASGRRVRSLARGPRPTGAHSFSFEPTSRAHVYYYRLRTDEGGLRTGRVVRQR